MQCSRIQMLTGNFTLMARLLLRAAAWSVVIVQVTNAGHTFPRSNIRTSCDWLGFSTLDWCHILDNIAAEFEALAVALMVVHSQQLPGKVFDSP